MIFRFPVKQISAPHPDEERIPDQKVRKFALLPVRVLSRTEGRYKELVWLRPYEQLQRLSNAGSWRPINNFHIGEISSDVKDEGSWPLRPLTKEEQYHRSLS